MDEARLAERAQQKHEAQDRSTEHAQERRSERDREDQAPNRTELTGRAPLVVDPEVEAAAAIRVIALEDPDQAGFGGLVTLEEEVGLQDFDPVTVQEEVGLVQDELAPQDEPASPLEDDPAQPATRSASRRDVAAVRDTEPGLIHVPPSGLGRRLSGPVITTTSTPGSTSQWGQGSPLAAVPMTDLELQTITAPELNGVGPEGVEGESSELLKSGDTAMTPAAFDVGEMAAKPTAQASTPAQVPPAGAEGHAAVAETQGTREAAATAPTKGPAMPPPSADQAADVLRQFRIHLAPGLRQVTIQLQPATLGRISIRIAIRDGRARTQVRAESPATLEALERHVPELRAALEHQGIEAGEFDLGLGFGHEASDGSDHFADTTGRTDAGNTQSGGERSMLASPALTRALLDDTGVDTYA